MSESTHCLCYSYPSTPILTNYEVLDCSRSIREIASYYKFKTKVAKRNLFEGLKIKTIHGEDVLMSDIWKGQTVIIKVLSRLGCCLCKQEAKMMSDMQPLFEKHNVRLIAIAFEDVDLHSFLSLGYWRWDIYLDPERKVYKAAGLTRITRLYQMSCMMSKYFMKILLRLKLKGVPNNLTGDLRQLGGTFVIDPEGRMIYDFRPKKMAHFPSLREIYALIGGDPSDLDEDTEEIGSEYFYTRERLELSFGAQSISMLSSRSSDTSSI